MISLPAFVPMDHLEFGIESLPSYLNRIGRGMGASLGQLIRLITEACPAYHPAESVTGIRGASPTILSGHTSSARRLVARLDAAMGQELAGRMTLLRIGSALSSHHLGTLHKQQMACPRCSVDLLEVSGGTYWTPLLWSLSVTTVCSRHGCRLIPTRVGIPPPNKVVAAELSATVQWTVCEARRLVDHCAEGVAPDIDELAVSAFLFPLRKRFPQATEMEFCRALGIDHASMRRYLQAEGRPGLRTVFRMAECAGVTPLELLCDGDRVGSELGLFDQLTWRDGGSDATRTRLRGAAELREISMHLDRMLKQKRGLMPLKKFAKDRGLSMGLLRYRFPEFCNAYNLRRSSEQLALQSRRVVSARSACHRYLKEHGFPSNEKNAVRDLMRTTRLSKHLLSDTLNQLMWGPSGKRSVGYQRQKGDML